MPLRRYKLYASGSATANAVDSFQFARPGVIKQISANLTFDSITDGASCKIQVSRGATSDFGIGTGAITQGLFQFSVYGNFVTSGLSQSNLNPIVETNDRVVVGDPLYVHAVIGGTVAYGCDILIVVDES